MLSAAVTSIGDRAFQGCTSLNEFTVSKQITHLGANAFEGVKHVSATLGYTVPEKKRQKKQKEQRNRKNLERREADE